MKIVYLALPLLAACLLPTRVFADGDEDPKNPAGHSSHGEAFNEGPRQAAYLMDGMPKVHFPVTCSNPEAQKFFDQGVGQLHGFWYFEAERSFRQILTIDPKCVMAYWGMARANINNQERGRGFLKKAVERKAELTERENMWLDSLCGYYRLNAPKDSKDDSKARRKDMIRALENIIEKFPDDIEAKAFLVFHIWDNAGDWPLGSRMAVDALAKEVLAVNPMHPVHHYRVHLWDGSEDARRSLNSAALCGQSGPGIAHLWHMPGGHTYTPVKRYRDAVWQQEASNRVDHYHMIHDQVMPDLIHNYAHNSSWLAGNLSLLGRVTPALDIAKNLIEMPRHPKYNALTITKAQPGYNAGNESAKLGREKLLDFTLRFELWDELAKCARDGYFDTGKDAAENARISRALAVASYMKKDLVNGDARAAEVSEALKKLTTEKPTDEAEPKTDAKTDDKTAEAKKPDAEKKPEAEKKKGPKSNADAVKKIESRIEELKVLRLFAEGNHKDFLAKFDKLELPRELKIRLRYEAGADEEAEKQARQFVKDSVNQVPPFALLADILWREKKEDEARDTFKKMRELDGKMDLNLPLFQRLKPIAQSLKLPDDWRVEPKDAADIGIRPPLDSLGPFLWKPSPAPKFTLPGPAGESVELSRYRGHPVLLMFYLGHGCAHCMAQLNAFSPVAKDFADQGVVILAISSDPADQVGRTLLKSKLSSGFPFPILSDPGRGVFKAYRAYDDFENIALHGTFLLDREGRIIWQDIGADPFTDVDFLLTESKRLLTIYK